MPNTLDVPRRGYAKQSAALHTCATFRLR